MTTTVEPVDSPETEVGAATSVLISVQEVVFSTAATAPVRRPGGKPSAVVAAMRRIFPTPKPREHAVRGDYPRRYSFLDNACMSRAMERL